MSFLVNDSKVKIYTRIRNKSTFYADYNAVQLSLKKSPMQYFYMCFFFRKIVLKNFSSFRNNNQMLPNRTHYWLFEGISRKPPQFSVPELVLVRFLTSSHCKISIKHKTIRYDRLFQGDGVVGQVLAYNTSLKVYWFYRAFWLVFWLIIVSVIWCKISHFFLLARQTYEQSNIC